MAKMKYKTAELGRVVSRDPEIHSGDLVFSGTRVPVDTLIDYLKGGHAIGEFLKDFPTVARWQVELYLEVSSKGTGSPASSKCAYCLTRIFPFGSDFIFRQR